MKKRIKSIIDNINNIKNRKNGKAILFFGFYFVFFLILILCARFAPRTIDKNQEYEGSSPINFSYAVLNSKNYNFNIIINIDNNNYSYVGEKYGDLELFEFNNKKYYRNENDYYVFDNSTWIKTDNPYKEYNFIDNFSIINFINSSYFESNTNYGDGKGLYKMLLSTNAINKLIDNKDTDIDELPNKIDISIDKDKNIEKIEFYLDSYCVNNGKCTKSMKIEINYSNYGKIKDIKNPINS